MKTREEKIEEMTSALSKASGLMKTVTGIGNNAARMACLDAFDQIKKHPRARVKIKGGGTPLGEFRRCLSMWKDYERQLIYTEENKFFHVDDMGPKLRERFGDITDREYYEFWCSGGFQAYADSYPFYTSLINKFRLAYAAHGVKEPEIMGWATAACCTLDMAVDIYDIAIKNCAEELGVLTEKAYRHFFKDFNLRAIADFWAKAVKELEPGTEVELTETEHKNIAQGFEQLMLLWVDEDKLFKSRAKAIEDYEEVFRTKGTMMKALKELAEYRDATKEG